MKIKTFLSALLILFAVVVNAQEPKPDKGKSPAQKAEHWVTKLGAEINFTPEERGKMVEIFKDFFIKAKEVKAEEKDVRIPEIKQARNQKVKELLGEERFEKYIAYMKEHEPKKKPPKEGDTQDKKDCKTKTE